MYNYKMGPLLEVSWQGEDMKWKFTHQLKPKCPNILSGGLLTCVEYL